MGELDGFIACLHSSVDGRVLCLCLLVDRVEAASCLSFSSCVALFLVWSLFVVLVPGSAIGRGEHCIVRPGEELVCPELQGSRQEQNACFLQRHGA